MVYRTRTYIAGGWTEDHDLIEQLYKWNESDHWGLHFSDAHELTQARDTSLPCSIKRSLSERLAASKTFVLIVSDSTSDLRKGSCQYCVRYDTKRYKCSSNKGYDWRSFIEFECDRAVKDNMRIVVLYNSTHITYSLCPEVIRHKGKHIAARGPYYTAAVNWDYQSIKRAIMG